MLAWKAQGAAFAADLTLLDGRHAKAVVVAGRSNPKGVALIIPSHDGTLQTLLPNGDFELLAAGDYIEIVTLQERAFGDAGFPKPEVTA